MRRVDLHDDALLDRARRNTLTASERERLNVHCRSCAACALELGWIEDGVHVPMPSANDYERGRSAVDAVLGAATYAPMSAEQTAALGDRRESMTAPKARPSGRAGRTRKRRAVALAFVGLFVSSAAAAYFTGVAQYVQTHWQEAVSVSDVMPAPVSTIRGTNHKLSVKPAQVPAPVVVATAEPTQVTEPVPTPAKIEPVLAPPVPPTAAPVAPSVADRARAQQIAADALFAAANSARADADYALALSRYARLSQLYPGTRAELMSRVSRGNLWLSRLSQPARARESFLRYLAARPSGTLAEEARVGLARSLATLGRNEDERAAWAALIERHPSSLHVAYARTRIAELSR